MKKNFQLKLISVLLFSFLIIYFNFDNFKLIIKERVPDNAYSKYVEIRKILSGINDKEQIDDLYYSFAKSLSNTPIIPKDIIIDGVEISSYSLEKVFPAKYGNSINSGYIDFYKSDLVFASGSGIFMYLQKQDDMSFKSTFIPTNITSLINYPEFYKRSNYGLKDILILNDEIYISVNFILNNSINNVIFKSKFSKDELKFEPFFIPNKFISLDYKLGINAHQSGGRIVEGRADSIIVSYGEYRYRDLAQSDSSVNGKILSISLKNSGFRIISKGHRNPQGLFFDEKNDYILSTEHGPAGGDEINYNSDIDKITNYGWPISSYGNHYDISADLNDHSESDNVIEGAPLYKSHFEYGFKEPIHYYKNNPGISQVVGIDYAEKIKFVVGTMGWPDLKKNERDYLRSLLFYSFDKENKDIELMKDIYINERVRDLIYNSENKETYFLGETSGKIFKIDNIINYFEE